MAHKSSKSLVKNEFGLTAQQEEFCQIVAKFPDKPFVDAYRKAYGRTDDKGRDCSYAAILSAKSHVQSRIKDIRSALVGKCPMTAEELLTFFADIARDDKQKVAVRMNAAKYLAEIMGMKDTEQGGTTNVQINNGTKPTIKFSKSKKTLEQSEEIEVENLEDK